ncbi:MAG: archease [Nitrosomonas sp.]
MMRILALIEVIQAQSTVLIEFEESDLELALVVWLNQILGKARELGMVFGHSQMTRQGNYWYGKAFGEKWRDGLERGIEVKGATLTMLSVKPRNKNNPAFSSASHGAGRALSRRQALSRWNGKEIIQQLAHKGILIRSCSMRGGGRGSARCV